MNTLRPSKDTFTAIPGAGMRPTMRTTLCALLALAGLTAGLTAQGAIIPKADNNSALNLGASWTGGTAPGSGDIALWDNTVAVNTNNDVLGTNLTWSGIQIANPAGPITIPSDGNTLTLGTSGINLLTASQSLILSNKLTINAPQYWQVGNGQTLDLEGALTNRPLGSAIMFSFDANPSSQAIIDPTIPGTFVVSDSGSLLLQGTIGNGTGAGVAFATVNDVDFAALNSNNQIVPESTLGLNTANPTGGTPNGSTGLSGVYDFTTTNSVGVRVTTTSYIDAMRFNTPQINPASSTTYAYNGVGSWEVLFKSGTVLDLNALLMTTNLGNSYVVFTSGGSMRIADSPNEFLVFQNNPASRLIFQSPITQRTAGATVSKLGVGTMEYQVACSYSGPTLLWGGTLLIDGAGSAGTGPITVHSGANFEGQNYTTNYAPVVVTSGGTNSVLLVSANGQFVNDTNLTFNAGATTLQFIYSNTIVPSATVAPLFVTNGTLTASNTVNINVLCPTLTAGQFPLIKYATLVTNSTSSVFPFSLAGIQAHVSAYLSNNVASHSIDLVVLGNNEPLTWAAGSATWDIGQSYNWVDAGANSDTYQQGYGIGDNVLFNDTSSGSSPIVVTLNSSVTPGSVTVNNSVLNYTISGSGSIGGNVLGESGSLTKTGTAELVLSTLNSFNGGVNLNGGILNFSTLNNLGLGGINFGGGTLQYNGNTDDISVRTVTLAAGIGTIDTAGQTVTYNNAIGNSGAGGLTKTGLGTLTLNGTNKYSGVTTVNQGTLALGTNAFFINAALTSPAIMVNSGAIFDTATSGVGLPLVSQVLGGVGTVKGEVAALAGSLITPATNGVVGTLSFANDLGINGGTVAMDVSAGSSDLITVAGNLGLTNGILQLNVTGTLANGRYKLISYGGSLLSGAGTSANLTVVGFSSANQLATLSDSTAGEIDLVIATGAHDPLVWSGAGNTWDLAGSQNWLDGSNPWAFTNGDSVTFNDIGGGNSTVSLQATVLPAAVVVSNSTAETYDFQDGTGVGGGRISGATTFVKDGTGTLINETASGYYGATVIKNGVLQIGNGNIGDIGTGNITNNASLIFAQGDGNTHTVTAPISGTGSVTVSGSSPVVLANNNTYGGTTQIGSSGTLSVGTGGANGTLGTGPVTNNNILFINRSGTMALSNQLAGSGAVVFSGAATVTYGDTAATNACAGNTYISNGIVKLATSTAIYSDGSAGDWLILDGSPTVAGHLDLNGHNAAVNAISGLNSTVNGVIDNNGGTSTTTNTLAIVGSATTTYSGSIVDNTGTGGKIALLVDGGALQTFDIETTAGNSFSGGTIISNSTVYFTAPAALTAPVCLGSGTVTLYNGTIFLPGYGADNGGGGYADLPNTVIVPTNFTGTLHGPYRGSFNGNVTGSGTITYINDYVRGSIAGNWSTFTGQIYFGLGASGGNMGINTTNGFGHVFLTNSTAGGTPAVAMYNTMAGTPTISIGELADDGSGQIESSSSGGGGGVAANFAVGSLNTTTNYGGTIIDNVGIIKVGTGGWILSGATLTYSGQTTVSNGTLVLSTNCTLPNSSPVAVFAPGILDVSATSPLILGNGTNVQILQGNGRINGSVTMDILGNVYPGTSNTLGTLTITNDLNLSQSGTNLLKLNRTNSPSNSDRVVATTIEAGGLLVVTNTGPDLHTGDKFQLFSTAVTGSFTSITLPVTTANGSITYVWTTNLAVDGSMVVAVGAPNEATYPTNMTASLSGNQLSLSWPADHLGWYLQAQTNTLGKGLTTNNWVDVPNSSAGTSVTITVSPNSPAVFYRMSLNP